MKRKLKGKRKIKARDSFNEDYMFQIISTDILEAIGLNTMQTVNKIMIRKKKGKQKKANKKNIPKMSF